MELPSKIRFSDEKVQKAFEKLGVGQETTIKALEFMKKVKLVKERQGKKTHKTERLFSLNNPIVITK